MGRICCVVYKKFANSDQLYSHLTIRDEGTSSRINPTREPQSSFAIGPLVDILRRAFKARSNFDWSKYLPAPPTGLSNLTLVPLNPYIPEQSNCVFGCEGFLCDAADGCQPNLICKNSICQAPSESQPGKIGDKCNSKKLCLEHLQCSDGTCQQCASRPTIPPANPRTRQVFTDPDVQCYNDRTQLLRDQPYCSLPSSKDPRGNPCNNAMDCEANQYCDWGLCKMCTEGCLGMRCRSNNKCKTGFCNEYGRCDYPGQPKIIAGHGASARKASARNNLGPKGAQRGPNKVRDEAMRINIPKEEAKATGNPAAAT